MVAKTTRLDFQEVSGRRLIMKPTTNPRNNIYTQPRNYSANCMHYAIIQVSKFRYVVAEYSGSSLTENKLPEFITVTEPLSYPEAKTVADKLTNARLKAD